MTLCRAMDRRTEHLLLLLWLSWCIVGTGSQEITVTTGESVTIRFDQSTTGSHDCIMCSSTKGCHQHYLLYPQHSLTFNFTCPHPEQHFIMEMSREINKDDDSLEGYQLLPMELPKLNRTYIWDINVPINVAVELSFPRGRLAQVDSDVCPDSVTYMIKGSVRNRKVHIGNFCRNGTISKVKIQGKTQLTLHVPWTEEIDHAGFNLSFLPPIKKLCIVEAVLLKPGSPVYFMTPNWPRGFPDDELMSWKFSFPNEFKVNVSLENYTYPECVKRTVDVYSGPPVMGKMKRLWKNAVVSVQNCEVDKTKKEVLTLRFKAELLSNAPERYELDLENVSVTFKQKSNLGSQLFCICQSPDSSNCNSELQLMPGDQANISFHTNCNSVQDIEVEATKVISCTELEICQVRNMDLIPPSALANLPVDHQTFKWVLNVPHHTTIELVSNRLKLRQCLPGETCNAGLMYHIGTFCNYHTNTTVGTFCPSGAIEKIQIMDSVEVEVRTSSGWNVSDLDLRVSFIPAIEENYIFYVVSDVGTTVNLLTSNGELGMPSQATSSWNIIVPADHTAELTFVRSSMPVCKLGHTSVTVEQTLNTGTSTWRETDVLPTTPIDLLGTIWVNVSNCKTESGLLKIIFEVMVKANDDMTDISIIVAAVTGALALLIIIAVVVCCVKRRKRKQLATPVGIYNPKVNVYVPGRKRKFGKARKDNDSHIYAVIDENRIYGPSFDTLMMDSIPEVDVYQPFTGRMGDIAPTPPARRSRPPQEDSVDTVPMVDNDLYKVCIQKSELGKSNGEMVTFLGEMGESAKDSSS